MQDNGAITEDEAGAFGDNTGTIDIVVNPYSNAAKGDTLRCYFDGIPMGYEFIDNPLTDFPIVFHQPAGELPDGTYLVHILAKDSAGNTNQSPPVEAVLARGAQVTLPPPEFTDAIGGGLVYTSVIALEGTHIHIPAYPMISAGDEVTLSFFVQNSLGDTVPESQYGFTRTLTEVDVADGFQHLIPQDYILTVSQGQAFASYRVHTTLPPDRFSDTAQVTLFSDGDLAAKLLGGSPGYFPAGSSVIQGGKVEYLAMQGVSPLPSAEVIFTITGNNHFQGNDTSEISITADSNGVAVAHISGEDTAQNTVFAHIYGSAAISHIGLSVKKVPGFSIPFLTLHPGIPSEPVQELTLSVHEINGVFNVMANDGVTFITNDGGESSSLLGIPVYPNNPYPFSVRNITGGYTLLTVTDVTGVDIFCQIEF